MIPIPLSRLATAGAISLAFACSSADVASSTDFPASTLSDHKKIGIALSTFPSEPPVAGTSSVQLLLTDPATGKPIEDEQITLVPWMPAMGHGSDENPVFQSLGKGQYLFTNVDLFMPGEWLLRFEFSGTVTDSALQQILFNVQ
jgi:YtkA-like